MKQALRRWKIMRRLLEARELCSGTAKRRLRRRMRRLSAQAAPEHRRRPGAGNEAGLNSTLSSIETQVLIIGGGVTGTALARDLALRGVDCILVEKHDLNAGASGRNHGLLHSGARYVAGDR